MKEESGGEESGCVRGEEEGGVAAAAVVNGLRTY